MNKKEYKQPSMKVVQLDNADLICTSPGEPSRMTLYEEEVNDRQQGSAPSSIWGTQW